LSPYDFYEVGEDLRGRSGIAPLGILRDALTPASLIKADYCNSSFRKAGEKLVVPVAVVAVAVDEDQLCDCFAVGLNSKLAS
jgi:hypothetical protein